MLGRVKSVKWVLVGKDLKTLKKKTDDAGRICGKFRRQDIAVELEGIFYEVSMRDSRAKHSVFAAAPFAHKFTVGHMFLKCDEMLFCSPSKPC